MCRFIIVYRIVLAELNSPDAIDTITRADDGIELVKLRHIVFPSEAVAEIFSVTESFTNSPLAKLIIYFKLII
jgi:hypothetical protein